VAKNKHHWEKLKREKEIWEKEREEWLKEKEDREEWLKEKEDLNSQLEDAHIQLEGGETTHLEAAPMVEEDRFHHGQEE